MTVFSSGRLSYARARALRWMPDLCRILARQSVDTDSGGQTLIETAGEELPCRVVERTVTGTEGAEGGRPVATAVWQVYLPWGTVVYPGDGVLWNGETLEVRDSSQDRSDGVMTVASVVRRQQRPALVIVTGGGGLDFSAPENSDYVGAI